MRGLGRVADHPDHRVPADHRERVGGLVVVDQPDQLAQLVGVEAGQELVVGERVGGENVRHGPRVIGCPTSCAIGSASIGQVVWRNVQIDQQWRSIMTSPIDELDGRILDLFSTRAAGRGARGEPAAARRPRHRAGPARPAGAGRGGDVLGPADLAGGPGLRGDCVRHAGDPAARGPHRHQRPAGSDPRGAGVLDGDRQRRPVVPDRGPLQRRPAAGDRRHGHRPRGGPLGHADRAGRADPSAPSRWSGRAPADPPKW